MPITLTKSTRKTIRTARLTPSRTTTSSSRPRVKHSEEDDEKDSLLKVEGVITSMVRILEHFTVRDRENDRFVRLTWTAKTRFLRGGKNAPSTVLRVGQPVRVSCDLADKKLLADIVKIQPLNAR